MLRCISRTLLTATVLSVPCGLTVANAANFLVTNTNSSGPGSLADAINQSNYASVGPDTITIQDNLGTILLQDVGGGANFPYVIADDVTIDGGIGNTIDGAGAGRAFLIVGLTPGSNVNVTISNLTIANGIAQGGAGGLGGGGGGMGAGGAILISGGDVTLENVAFTGNDAVGGNGGISAIASGGGGGGVGGNGGAGGTTGFPGGGGGGGSIPGADGGNGGNGLPGGDGGSPSGGPGPAGGAYNPSGSGGDGSNAVNSGDGGAGGGSGVGGNGGAGGNGADGGGGGGGAYGSGGGVSGTGGDGGLGGGGGGGSSYNGSGGNGGFGGGGGGGADVAGAGGFGGGSGAAGSGAVGAGGGGAGFGGAVFVREGSTLTLRGDVTFNGGSVTGGTGADSGHAAGSGLFLKGSGNLAIDAGSGQNQIIGDDIADEAGVVAGGYIAPTGFTPGSWSLTKTGEGTLTLSGANSYSGGTFINGGVVSVSSDQNLGAAAGQIDIDAATLRVTGTSYNGTGRAITLGAGGGTVEVVDPNLFFLTMGNIAGAGGLSKTGAGALVLFGNNSYSGTTTITQGFLGAVGGNAIPDQSAVMLAAGTQMVIASSETIGSLSGAGTVGGYADPADATYVLTTGGDNSSTNFSGQIYDNAASLGGAGIARLSLAKTGTGTMTLGGANTFTGPTSVAGGSLIVNGSIGTSSLLTVGNGAQVGGTGLLAPTIIANGGTLAPGNGIGTLTVNGNLAFNGGSYYAVEVSPADADRTNVTGVATLTGGVVVLSYAPGTYVTRNYTILNAAGGLGGTTFAGLTAGLLPGLTSSLEYDANNVYLRTASGSGGNPAYNALTRNQKAVANSLLSYFDSTGSLPVEFATLDANGLTLVSGEVATTAISSGLHAADLFIGTISDPFVSHPESSSPESQQVSATMEYSSDGAQPSSVRALAALGEETASAAETANTQLSMSGSHPTDALGSYTSSPWTIWGSAYGGAQDIDGKAAVGSADLTTRNWGIATGFDYGIEDGKIGFALGGGGSSFSLENNLGSGNAAVFNAGIYGSKAFGNAYVAAAAAYAFNSVDTTRSVFGDTLEADYDAHTLSGRLEGGYRVDTSLAAITPYAAVQGSSYFLPDYLEKSVNGGPFALSYDSQTQSALRTELGARIEHIIATDTGFIKLSGRLAWAWNAENARDVTSAFQSLAAPSFTIDGAEPDEQALLVDAGAEFGLSDSLGAKLSFNGEFSENVTAYGAAATLRYKW